MRPTLSSEPDTERDPSVPPAADTDENTVIPDDGAAGNDETRASHEDARTPEEPRAEHPTCSRDAGTRVGDTSPAPPREPERRGASAYLEALAESEGHRVSNPIAGSIEAFGDEVSRTSGSAFDGDRCATLCPFRLDTLDGAS
jgi:hypothetical protein